MGAWSLYVCVYVCVSVSLLIALRVCRFFIPSINLCPLLLELECYYHFQYLLTFRGFWEDVIQAQTGIVQGIHY